MFLAPDTAPSTVSLMSSRHCPGALSSVYLTGCCEAMSLIPQTKQTPPMKQRFWKRPTRACLLSICSPLSHSETAALDWWEIWDKTHSCILELPLWSLPP